MSLLGRSIVVRGEVRTSEDLVLQGRVEGPILAESCSIVVGETAQLAGDAIARDITVFGRVDGRLIATDIVDVRGGATMHGDVLSRRFILDDEALFNGRVEPQHLEAALRVAEFERRKRGAAS